MHLTTQHRITVILSATQYEALRQRASEAQTSMATIVRQLMAATLDAKPGKRQSVG